MRALPFALLLMVGITEANDGFSGTEWDAAAETAVVFNTDFPGSEDLARYYAEKRGIAADRVVGFPMSKEETITRGDYERTLRDPFQVWLTGRNIHVVALIRGVPLRISRVKPDPATGKGDETSVDSELAAMRLSGNALSGAVPNPYFASRARFPEVPKAANTFLVGRLDAASDETVRRMIDDSISTEANGLSGRAVIDLALKQGGYQQGENWLNNCVKLFRSHGIASYVNRVEDLIPEHFPLPDTALYFGWYTGEVFGPFKEPGFRFATGAVVCHLHSFSAKTVRDGGVAWAAPLLERGAAATFGNVWEPYLAFTVHFDLLCERLLAGYTLAEAGWAATPGLSWMTVVLGDPLYRPFAGRSLPEGENRAYAMLRGLAERSDGADFKRAVVELAEKRGLPRLLELLALLVAADGSVSEASGLLQHARSLYTNKADQLRTWIYEIDLLKATDSKRAAELSAKVLEDAEFAAEPSRQVLQPKPATKPDTPR